MAESQRVFHFIFGLREQAAPFHLLHYLCLASCFAVNRPDVMHFHYRHEPHGPWWDRIKPRLSLRRVPDRVRGFTAERYAGSHEGRLIERLGLDYAHEADFLRLDILLAEGGVYVDMDTLFVRAYLDAWFTEPFAIGEELSPWSSGSIMRPSLCNAVMFAQPGAAFATLWRERMEAVFDGHWSRHSCEEAARVWQDMPDAVRVLPTAYFYHYGSSISGLRALLEESDRDWPGLYSIHLWGHLWWDAARTDFSCVHAGEIDVAWMRERNCTLARLARPYLDV